MCIAAFQQTRTTWTFQQMRIGHMYTHIAIMYLFVLLLSSFLEPETQFVGNTFPPVR